MSRSRTAYWHRTDRPSPGGPDGPHPRRRGHRRGARALPQISNSVAADQRIDAARLFDRFYTADPSRSARTSGLGLSIAHVLVEQLGGEVTAHQDAAGAPVTITVRIPHAPENADTAS